MKRFISALAFCVSLLVLLSLFLFPPAEAKENVIIKLLNLPAPPPPNPLVNGTRQRDQKFYDKNNPPSDNAPIEDLIDYWTNQASNYRGALFFTPTPSERTLARLANEMAKKPELALQLINIWPDNKAAAEAIKDLYDKSGGDGGMNEDERRQLRQWLRFNSPHFTRDLERVSQQIKDENNYVSLSNENNLLALTRYDFDKASPIINQLYNDSSQPVSRALATWALYRRALETDSLSDIERYRGELMRMVEDRNMPEGVRDKANDALTHERDFPGRDEWSFSLFEDETLVNMTRFTMLTTLIMYSPPEKYVPKMIALLQKTSNPTVRAAAARNLETALSRDPGEELEIEIIKSLLPWLEDPTWITGSRDSRSTIVRKLIEYRIPESVPGLINMLDEKERQIETDATRGSANTAMPENDQAIKNAIEAGFMKLGLSEIDVSVSNGEATLTGIVAKERLPEVMKIAVEADVKKINNKLNVKSSGPMVFSYPYRQSAIAALGKQKDGRAVPALRRVLNEINGYERSIAVKAILDCGGFSVVEQMAALEAAAKKTAAMAVAEYADMTGANANIPDSRYYANNIPPRLVAEPEIKDLLGQQLMESEEISDELARAIVDRIEVLDEKDPSLAAAYRRMILKWQNAVINMLLLRDVKRDIADEDTIVRLLSQRKSLREKQSTDVSDLLNGKPAAKGIAACLFEDQGDYAAILDNGDAETLTAMLACARLIRSPLPVAKVAENLKSQNQLLQIAAERYLESEDSPEARGFVLARHPNEAMILGSTSAFFVKGSSGETGNYLWQLYQSLGDESLYNGWSGSYNDEEIESTEKKLQAEVKKDLDLLGVYAYDSNFIRIYKDRVIFSWDEDESRYRERPLTQEEFDDIKSYFTANRVDELPPFLSCGGDYCSAKELVMLGRSGGRRVYMNGSGNSNVSEFFTWLDKYFADLKLTRATLKYALSREIPGLEILLASDDLHAETVWAQGTDVRVAASDVAARKKIEAEIQNLNSEDDLDGEEVYSAENEAKKAALTEKRRYDGFAWHKVAGGESAGIAAQPPNVEYIPLRDGLAVQPSDEQWKARAGDVEIRSSSEGLYKVVRGRLIKLRKGFYDNVVVTPNGRWAVAVKSGEEGGGGIVRVDLVTNREYPIVMEGYGQKYPVAYIPTLNKVLVINNERYYEHGDYGGVDSEKEDAAPDDVNPAGMFLLDPATGVMQPIAGEFRPLSQQTFRPLQNASKPNEFWAAIYDPEKKETQVGIYDTRVFVFKPMLRIPKIKFNSMSLWVDEAAGKAYFVYRGHLLALPLGK